MKQILIIFFLAWSFIVFGQANDTTIYKVVEEMPRFPGCEDLDTTLTAKTQCAQTALLLFFNRNIAYPWQAREQNLEGSVVLSLVVEKDGYISNPVVVKDIGGGCGEEALRVANGINDALKEAKLTWVPGKKAGKSVRTQITIPIRFKLQDPPDFVIANIRDTVYVVVDDSLAYTGGEAALNTWLKSHLKYPAQYRDSCKVGTMDITLLARPDGLVKVLDLADYWSLGNEFRWEAIKAATSTWGQWQPAIRKARQVPSSYELTVTFLPDASRCKQQIANYERAEGLANEGSSLFNEGKQEEGIQKLNEALALFPNNANFLYLRGQGYMNMKKMAEACADFKKIQSMVTLEMVNQLIPVICK
jgi:tetratricopeptide (TPR) repeat protein